MKNVHYEEIATVADLIRRGEISPVELTETLLSRIESLDGRLRSYAQVTAETALTAARTAEREISRGHYRGALHGIPVAVKDLFWTSDAPAAAGMKIFGAFRPSRDATAVRRLRDAGAIILGKLAMTEGAYSDHHPSVSPPVNPWNSNYWTGISSSGPAVAVAAGLCYGALASDTGGSIRWPCSATGLTGIKPTWGRVSRDGTFALAPSMDHVGPMARSAADAALLLEVIAGSDSLDPTALQVSPPPVTSFSGLRFGFDPALNDNDVDATVAEAMRNTIETLRRIGGLVVEVTAPDVAQAVADWPEICAVEAAVAHEATYPARRADYGPVLAEVLERGRHLSAMDLQRANLRRMALRGAFDALFTRIDVLVCPVQSFAPLTLEAIGVMGKQPELIARLQRFTCPFNMTGLPTVVLPAGYDDQGMPLGVQFVGGALRDDVVLASGIAFQAATDWHRRHPAFEVQ